MKADLVEDLVQVTITEAEYRIITAGLRELGAELHEQDFLPRIGAPREAIEGLAQSFFDESIRLGIEE